MARKPGGVPEQSETKRRKAIEIIKGGAPEAVVSMQARVILRTVQLWLLAIDMVNLSACTLVVEPARSLGFEVYVFGSRAKGTQSPSSDLDLMLEGLTSDQWRVFIGESHERISEINFPLKVDHLHLDDFAASDLADYHQQKAKWPRGEAGSVEF